MKLKEYVEGLVKLMKDQPELADLDVITAADDEGNYYNEVHCESTFGCYSTGEFIKHTHNKRQINAVCVN